MYIVKKRVGTRVALLNLELPNILNPHSCLFCRTEVSNQTPSSSSNPAAESPGKQPLDAVPVSQTPAERFSEYLVSRGKRMTPQKSFLVEQVFSRHDHFDVDQLLEQLPRRENGKNVSRSTVYRALEEFVKAGLLREFELNGRSVYEHDYGYPEHDHFYCVKCHELSEFQSDKLAELLDEIAREHLFRVKTHRLIIQGVCNKCSDRRGKRRLQDRV